jgi:K+-sensing histidine kinase KdpD
LEIYPSILVCTTLQRDCERLIHAAAHRLAENGTLHVLHVADRPFDFFENIREGEALEHLFATAKSSGAEMTIVNAPQVAETIAQFAEHYHVHCIFLGVSRPDSSHRYEERLGELLRDSDIQVETIYPANA